MTHDYTLNFQDYRVAQRLYHRCRRAAGIRLKLWLYALPALAAFLFAADLYLRGRREPGTYDPLLAPTFFFVWMAVWVAALRPWHLRRGFRKLLPPGHKKDIRTQFSFDETGVISTIPGRSEGRFFWSAVQDFAEDKETALLFIDKKKFLFVPKRAMDEQSWDSLRRLVAQKVAQG